MILYIVFLSRAADGCVLYFFSPPLPSPSLVIVDLGNPEYANENKVEKKKPKTYRQQFIYTRIITSQYLSCVSYMYICICIIKKVLYYVYLPEFLSNVAFFYCHYQAHASPPTPYRENLPVRVTTGFSFTHHNIIIPLTTSPYIIV